MAVIQFKLKATNRILRASGEVYRAPRSMHPIALHQSVEAWTTRRSIGIDLKPGKYVYVFDLQDGDGPFELRAYLEGTNQQVGEYSSDTAMSGNLRINFEFTVRS